MQTSIPSHIASRQFHLAQHSSSLATVSRAKLERRRIQRHKVLMYTFTPSPFTNLPGNSCYWKKSKEKTWRD